MSWQIAVFFIQLALVVGPLARYFEKFDFLKTYGYNQYYNSAITSIAPVYGIYVWTGVFFMDSIFNQKQIEPRDSSPMALLKLILRWSRSPTS